MQYKHAITALLLAPASPLLAQGLDGQIALGLVAEDGDVDATFFADATYTLEVNGLGFELGSYGVWTNEDSPHETYATVFADILSGRLHAGVPRPAYDQFAISAADHSLPHVGIAALRQTRSFATTASAELEEVPLGLLYTSDEGRSSYALSYHVIDALDSSVLSFGAGYDAGAWQLSGGLEYVDTDDGSDANAKLQVATQIDQMDLSVSYFANGYADTADLAEIALGYHFSDRITGGAFLTEEIGGSDTTIGATVDVSFGSNLYLQAGVAHQDDADTAYSAFVGWAF